MLRVGVVVVSGRGISNEGWETEGVTGIWGRGGRFSVRVDERVDTGESVIRKVLLVESRGADGEGDWESSFKVFFNLTYDKDMHIEW